MNDISIVMQGPCYHCTNDFLAYYCEIDEIKKVIYSGWWDDKGKITYSHPKLELVFNEPLDNNGPGNRNAQIKSTIEGLWRVETEFAIKLRSDLYFVNIGDVISIFLYKTKDLVTANDNARYKIISCGPNNKYPFFCMDFIMSGSTYDLIDMFDIPLDNSKNHHQDLWDQIVCETYIHSHYCSKRDNKSKYMLDNYIDYLTLGSKFKDEAVKYYISIYNSLYYIIPHRYRLPKHNHEILTSFSPI